MRKIITTLACVLAMACSAQIAGPDVNAENADVKPSGSHDHVSWSKLTYSSDGMTANFTAIPKEAQVLGQSKHQNGSTYRGNSIMYTWVDDDLLGDDVAIAGAPQVSILLRVPEWTDEGYLKNWFAGNFYFKGIRLGVEARDAASIKEVTQEAVMAECKDETYDAHCNSLFPATNGVGDAYRYFVIAGGADAPEALASLYQKPGSTYAVEVFDVDYINDDIAIAAMRVSFPLTAAQDGEEACFDVMPSDMMDASFVVTSAGE